MVLKLHDTASRKKRVFVPQDETRVTMYVCGPTVYAPAHVGNFRPEVVFDVLFRVLRHAYGADRVVFARNFTDVDDKINAAAAREDVEISVISERYARIYHEDARALNILPKTFEPKATGHMDDIIAFIDQLIASGHAYAAEGHVLFSVASFQGYGSFSRRSLEDMIAGARVEVAPYKTDPADFVLWKPAKPGEPAWESPWGPGRPGWHIECSAMIERQLGETIDIHGGGIDLVFPHHENEIAQSVCAHGGKPLANYWLHNGFLSMNAEKMSKSEGNIVTVHEMLARGFPGEVIRYALLTGHYRAPLDWSEALMERARKSLDRLYGVLRRLKPIEPAKVAAPDAVLAALEDDLNTPRALAALFEIAGRANKAEDEAERAKAKGELLAAGALLGLLSNDPDTWFGLESISEAERAAIDRLVAERAEARKAKDFARADAIRDQLDQRGIVVEDSPEGSVWRMGSGATETRYLRAAIEHLSKYGFQEGSAQRAPRHAEAVLRRNEKNYFLVSALGGRGDSSVLVEEPLWKLRQEVELENGSVILVVSKELLQTLQARVENSLLFGYLTVDQRGSWELVRE
ncbi:cysteine--tRNA ligase [Marinicauda algicola]|uniref:Cysteine--tRNA ligase n=1 Tax=Marinicauda algicola TaxID=2029849 RepID=A0A4S2H4N8_9PROT|nr:cysteine--tRNA ligase [Marinicauda algicola]TGY90503.1 cysteine--tRNA ligase [Marinicauda algicola]